MSTSIECDTFSFSSVEHPLMARATLTRKTTNSAPRKTYTFQDRHCRVPIFRERVTSASETSNLGILFGYNH